MLLSLHAAFMVTGGASVGGAHLTRETKNGKISQGFERSCEFANSSHDQYAMSGYFGIGFLISSFILEFRGFGVGNYDREPSELKNTWQGGGELSLSYKISPELTLGIIGGAVADTFADFYKLKGQQGVDISPENKITPHFYPRLFFGGRVGYYINSSWRGEVTVVRIFDYKVRSIENQPFKGTVGEMGSELPVTLSMDYHYVTTRVTVGCVYEHHFAKKGA